MLRSVGRQKSLTALGYVTQGDLQAAITKLNDSILRMHQKMEAEDGDVGFIFLAHFVLLVISKGTFVSLMPSALNFFLLLF